MLITSSSNAFYSQNLWRCGYWQCTIQGQSEIIIIPIAVVAFAMAIDTLNVKGYFARCWWCCQYTWRVLCTRVMFAFVYLCFVMNGLPVTELEIVLKPVAKLTVNCIIRSEAVSLIKMELGKASMPCAYFMGDNVSIMKNVAAISWVLPYQQRLMSKPSVV